VSPVSSSVVPAAVQDPAEEEGQDVLNASKKVFALDKLLPVGVTSIVTQELLAGTMNENHSSYAVPQELDGEPVVAWYKVVEYGEEQLVTGVNK